MLEDEKLDNLTGALYAACPAANQITVDGDGSMSRISDMTDCDTTSITEYCDANVNYKSATLRPNIEIACTNISITNSTSGEVMNLPGVTQLIMWAVLHNPVLMMLIGQRKILHKMQKLKFHQVHRVLFCFLRRNLKKVQQPLQMRNQQRATHQLLLLLL